MNELIERNNQVVDENRRKWQLNRHNKDVRLYLIHAKISTQIFESKKREARSTKQTGIYPKYRHLI